MSPVVGTESDFTCDPGYAPRVLPRSSSSLCVPAFKCLITRGLEMKSWTQRLLLRPLLCLQIKKLRVFLSLCSSAVLHQRCISFLERDLAICLSTSLSQDCVVFPIYARTHRPYLGLYQFIRTAHPFSQNISLEYCIRTSLCHWSLLG